MDKILDTALLMLAGSTVTLEIFCVTLALSLPPTVESVGDGAFSGCSSLATLTLPEGLRRLGSNAFDGCPVESVTVPASLEIASAFHRFKNSTIGAWPAIG